MCACSYLISSAFLVTLCSTERKVEHKTILFRLRPSVSQTKIKGTKLSLLRTYASTPLKKNKKD